ncbi:MAG: hypothetical protein L6R41_005558 [Letrouitia leprolyta]|nr:MAG: hypothetical protein L6R41_005558 [Letrouitia leprolyta]
MLEKARPLLLIQQSINKMKTALLVIDMQGTFTSIVHSCLPNILSLASTFKSHNLPRIFTQHGHTKEELTPPLKNQLVKRWTPSGSIARGSKDWELMPDIAKAAQDCPIIHKNTYDAVINTNLADVLKELGTERVVVCGVMTNCCVDTTARSVFNRGFETWLVSDACGTTTKEQHEGALDGFRFAYGEPMKTAEVLEKLGKERL